MFSASEGLGGCLNWALESGGYWPDGNPGGMLEPGSNGPGPEGRLELGGPGG